MRFKMHNATASTSKPSLCSSCRFAQRMRMSHNNNETVICGRMTDFIVRGTVAECSNYDDKRLPTVQAMKEIAWHVSSDKNRPIGFLSPAEYRAERRKTDDGEAPLVTPDGNVYY